MAMRDLKAIQKEAEALQPEEQVQLAHYLLERVKKLKAGEEALLSEALLARDWLRPEEDEAWRDL
jgi:hypothetical protein